MYFLLGTIALLLGSSFESVNLSIHGLALVIWGGAMEIQQAIRHGKDEA